MTQWDCSEQDIYHFPWHQVRSVMRVPSVKWWDTSLGTREPACPASLSSYVSGTLALWATLQTSFGFMTGLTMWMIWNIDQPSSQQVTIRIPPNWKHWLVGLVPIKIVDNYNPENSQTGGVQIRRSALWLIQSVQNDLQERNNPLILCIRCNRLGIITNITPDPAPLSPAGPGPRPSLITHLVLISSLHRKPSGTLTDNPATPC